LDFARYIHLQLGAFLPSRPSFDNFEEERESHTCAAFARYSHPLPASHKSRRFHRFERISFILVRHGTAFTEAAELRYLPICSRPLRANNTTRPHNASYKAAAGAAPTNDQVPRQANDTNQYGYRSVISLSMYILIMPQKSTTHHTNIQPHRQRCPSLGRPPTRSPNTDKAHNSMAPSILSQTAMALVTGRDIPLGRWSRS
jgi:hypothetical protein